MSLIINKVASSSVQINYNYLESDLIFGYEAVATYKIDFADITYTNESNVLFSGIEALRQAYQQKNLVARIGADEFINGRLTSQSFEQSALVGSSSCSVTIEESNRLGNYSANEFAQKIPSPQWIESFSETFSFSRSGDTYSSNRNVSLKYKQDAGSQFLNNAKLFLRNFYFVGRPNLGYHVDGISEKGRIDGGFRPLISETIDLLGLSVSLQENLETSYIFGNYSKKESVGLELDQGGFTKKTYSIEIKALKEPLEQVADQACAAVIDALIASESGSFGSPIEIEKSIQKDGGEITIKVGFSNNPALNSLNTITYSTVRTRREKFYDYAFSCEIASEGENSTAKLKNTKDFWASVVPTFKAKVAASFPEAVLIFEKSRSFSIQNLPAKISETVVYSNDLSYDSDSLPDGILKMRVSNNQSFQKDRIRTFVDIQDGIEKIEQSNLQTVGGGSFSIEVVQERGKGIFFAADYISSFNFDPDLGTATSVVKSDTISISNEGSTSRVITYEFF
jgi:hypothetical protein